MDDQEIVRLASNLGVGKRLPSAVYLHRSLLTNLPDELEGVIRRISGALKLVETDWNVVKIHQDWPRISFLLMKLK